MVLHAQRPGMETSISEARPGAKKYQGASLIAIFSRG